MEVFSLFSSKLFVSYKPAIRPNRAENEKIIDFIIVKTVNYFIFTVIIIVAVIKGQRDNKK